LSLKSAILRLYVTIISIWYIWFFNTLDKADSITTILSMCPKRKVANFQNLTWPKEWKKMSDLGKILILFLCIIIYDIVTPCVQSLLIWSSSALGMGLHKRSISLTFSSLLRLKWLTWRCYVWNNKDYKLALTVLNFQGGTKPTNYNSSHVPHAIFVL
jgi:hypothetical protein